MTEHTLLHLRDQFLIEQASSLLMQRAIDGNNIALPQHFLKTLHTSASDLFFDFWFEGLIVEVEQLLAIKRLQSSQDALSDTANGDGPDDFVLEIILALCDSCNVPVSRRDLLVGWDEVANEDEDGHEDVLGDGDNVGARDFGNGDSAVGLVGSVKVNMVRSDARGHGELEILGFGETLGGQVTRMEARV